MEARQLDVQIFLNRLEPLWLLLTDARYVTEIRLRCLIQFFYARIIKIPLVLINYDDHLKMALAFPTTP